MQGGLISELRIKYGLPSGLNNEVVVLKVYRLLNLAFHILVLEICLYKVHVAFKLLEKHDYQVLISDPQYKHANLCLSKTSNLKFKAIHHRISSFIRYLGNRCYRLPTIDTAIISLCR